MKIRHTFLGVAAAWMLLLALLAAADQRLTPSALGAAPPLGAVRVYVISIDSLGPDEITQNQAPFLYELKQRSFSFDSVAVPPTTTVPNHVAMLTGVRGNRNGFVANVSTNSEYRQVFEADHLFTRLARERPDVSTALFSDAALWDRVFLNTDRAQTAPGVSVITEDPFSAFLAWAIAMPPPQFALVHDAKVDEIGHGDGARTFSTLEQARAARSAAILEVDHRLRQLVGALQIRRDIWSQTVLIIASDHSMDFAPPTRFIDPFGKVQDAAECGDRSNRRDDAVLDDPLGQQLVDVLPCTDETKEHLDARVDKIVEVLRKEFPGIGLVVSDRTAPSRGDLGVEFRSHWQEDPRDVLMFARPGYTFFPFFGVHGHPITQETVLMVTGGHQALADPATQPRQPDYPNPAGTSFASPLDRPSVMSIASTAAPLFRLNRDHFYEGTPLKRAFDPGLLTGYGD